MNIKRLTVGPVQTNCYIVSDKGNCVIIDPGAESIKISQFIAEKKLNVRAILLTHGHFDHIMAVDELKNKYQIKVYAYKDEEKLLEDAVINCSADIGYSYVTKADVYLDDGDDIAFDDIKFKVISTPGHTAGSCCYYMYENGILFAGDTLFFGSMGRTDLPTGNEELIYKSLRKLVDLPAETKVYCGHGRDTTVLIEKNNNPYIR